ncbi:MAG TPA: type II toxin-antitoxin system RelE/ParE family toxin [Ignavibacteria bacterium]|nr:type II toxin-antitoxin system RelE/ParE family toxin [Ignavibacteria bacterium]
MKNGYRIEWTDHALKELSEIFAYLKNNWTERELQKLSQKIEKTIELISKNPELFQKTYIKKDVRRVVITKHNSLYYRINIETIEILSFFANRKNPNKLEL